MRINLLASTLALTLFLLPAQSHAQGVEESLEALALQNAKLYVNPIANGLGTALASGFAQSAQAHSVLGFDLGVRLMGSIVPDNAMSFQAVLPTSASFNGSSYESPYGFEAGSTGITPTAVGQGDGVLIVPQGDFRNALLLNGENPSDYDFEFPGGEDLAGVPFALIQGSVGVGLGTDLVLRLIPTYEVNEEVGEVSAFGYGIKHALDQWFPAPFPLSVALLAGRQNFKVGTYLDASSTVMGLIASKGLGLFSLYGTAAYESSNLDVRYTVRNPDDSPALPADGTSFAFSYESTDGTRFGAGIGFRLLILDLSAEYALGSYNTASIKAGISFN